jgi:hypothetical protein
MQLTQQRISIFLRVIDIKMSGQHQAAGSVDGHGAALPGLRWSGVRTAPA